MQRYKTIILNAVRQHAVGKKAISIREEVERRVSQSWLMTKIDDAGRIISEELIFGDDSDDFA
jgi:hypothetical protein